MKIKLFKRLMWGFISFICNQLLFLYNNNEIRGTPIIISYSYETLKACCTLVVKVQQIDSINLAVSFVKLSHSKLSAYLLLTNLNNPTKFVNFYFNYPQIRFSVFKLSVILTKLGNYRYRFKNNHEAGYKHNNVDSH